MKTPPSAEAYGRHIRLETTFSEMLIPAEVADTLRQQLVDAREDLKRALIFKRQATEAVLFPYRGAWRIYCLDQTQTVHDAGGDYTALRELLRANDFILQGPVPVPQSPNYKE